MEELKKIVKQLLPECKIGIFDEHFKPTEVGSIGSQNEGEKSALVFREEVFWCGNTFIIKKSSRLIQEKIIDEKHADKKYKYEEIKDILSKTIPKGRTVTASLGFFKEEKLKNEKSYIKKDFDNSEEYTVPDIQFHSIDKKSSGNAFYQDPQEFEPIKVFTESGQVAEIKIITSSVGKKYGELLAENESLKREIAELRK